MLPIVTIEGRVVADPTLRFGPSGAAVTNLRLVASKRKQDESGEWVDDKTLWIDAVCFKKLAENVAESIAKGDLVVITGSLQTDEWEDKDTHEKRSKPIVVANNVAASLLFRTVRHGEGRAARSGGESSSGGSTPTPDPWGSTPQSDEPPF